QLSVVATLQRAPLHAGAPSGSVVAVPPSPLLAPPPSPNFKVVPPSPPRLSVVPLPNCDGPALPQDAAAPTSTTARGAAIQTQAWRISTSRSLQRGRASKSGEACAC